MCDTTNPQISTRVLISNLREDGDTYSRGGGGKADKKYDNFSTHHLCVNNHINFW